MPGLQPAVYEAVLARLEVATKDRYEAPFARFLQWATVHAPDWEDYTPDKLAATLASHMLSLGRLEAEMARKSVGTFFDAMCNLKPGSLAAGSPLVAAAQRSVVRKDPPPPADAGVASPTALLQFLKEPVDLAELPFDQLHDRTMVLLVLHCLLRPKSVRQLIRGGDGFELSLHAFRFRTMGVKTTVSTAMTERHDVPALEHRWAGACLVRHALEYDRRVDDAERRFFFVRVSQKRQPERGQQAEDTISNRIERFGDGGSGLAAGGGGRWSMG